LCASNYAKRVSARQTFLNYAERFCPFLLDDSLPDDDARLNDLVDLEEYEPVVEVTVEVVDVGVHAEGVHPVAVH
jgi:hypothetical protein